MARLPNHAIRVILERDMKIVELEEQIENMKKERMSVSKLCKKCARTIEEKRWEENRMHVVNALGNHVEYTHYYYRGKGVPRLEEKRMGVVIKENGNSYAIKPLGEPLHPILWRIKENCRVVDQWECSNVYCNCLIQEGNYYVETKYGRFCKTMCFRIFMIAHSGYTDRIRGHNDSRNDYRNK